ncbi:MAG: AI-2E family transporter [Patescibacteria group bacterium]|jgi:predicted PurR-regulated permease PerM
MKENHLPKYFLIVLVILAFIACVLLFKPFLVQIIISAVLVSVFYSPYLKLSRFLGGKKKLASLIMCFLLLLIVIIPATNLIIFFGKKSVVAYSESANFINSYSVNLKDNVSSFFEVINIDEGKIENIFLEITKSISDWLAKSATLIIKGTTNFLISLVLIVLTMFFFFIDGERILQKVKLWSPLPNKYDLEIFKKFREVSYTAMISVFVTAGIQGIIGAIGFLIVGIPAFYPGLLLAIFSLIPYIGAMIVYVPIGIYLILVGQVFKGVFILAWGGFIIGNADNLIRAYLLHGRTKINPIFIIFSLAGGILLFGFWGLVLGPLTLALVSTIFHIYELEYHDSLEK